MATIRPLDPQVPAEVSFVVQGWQQTLREVLGEDRGGEIKSDEWVEQHVLRHLDPGQLTGQVYLAELADSTIVGHTVLRLDDDGFGNVIGLFATIFVVPRYRRQGIASALVEQGESWMRDRSIARALTYTDEGNVKLHRLFARHGYATKQMPQSFVALAKDLAG